MKHKKMLRGQLNENELWENGSEEMWACRIAKEESRIGRLSVRLLRRLVSGRIEFHTELNSHSDADTETLVHRLVLSLTRHPFWLFTHFMSIVWILQPSPPEWNDVTPENERRGVGNCSKGKLDKKNKKGKVNLGEGEWEKKIGES